MKSTMKNSFFQLNFFFHFDEFFIFQKNDFFSFSIDVARLKAIRKRYRCVRRFNKYFTLLRFFFLSWYDSSIYLIVSRIIASVAMWTRRNPSMIILRCSVDYVVECITREREKNRLILIKQQQLYRLLQVS